MVSRVPHETGLHLFDLMTMQFEEPVIIVANSLTPSEVLMFSQENVIGIVTHHGGFTSHVSLMATERNIPYKLNTIVVDISPKEASENGYLITAMNKEEGLFVIETKAVILAMGCRERPRGMLNIPGERPAGIFSAGTAQKLINEKQEEKAQEVLRNLLEGNLSKS